MQPFIVGVRFSKIGKAYHFDATKFPELKLGDTVVVETSRGWQLGEVCELVKQPQNPPEGGWKPINRLATSRDLVLQQLNRQKEQAVVEACRQRAVQLKLEGVKIIMAEYAFDGSRLAIHFSTESEEKVELKSLRQDMQKQFAPVQVELRQIGPRDVAKFMGGMGACGLETRCCTRFINEFNSISIKMAKEQGISLTPSEITGMCGRLRCCLYYEYEFYHTARQQMPKKNKVVKTPAGEGKIIDAFPLRDSVMVELFDSGYREYKVSEITVIEEAEAQRGNMDRPRQPDRRDNKPRGGEHRRR